MLNASVGSSNGLIAADLDCSGCGRHLIKDGQFKCCRCQPKRLVPATLGQKAIVCPRHREPVVLMRKDQQGQYRAHCQNRSCPNYQQRIGTIIKPKEEKMAGTTVGVGPGVKTNKKTKTQELRDWLDAEIKRVESDINTLTWHGNPEASPRYVHLTSDERVKKVAKDQEKVKRLRQYMEGLYNAKDLNPVDIDGIEAFLMNEIEVVRGFETKFDIGVWASGVWIRGSVKNSRLLIKFCYSLSNLGDLEIEIWDTAGFVKEFVAGIRPPGEHFACIVDHSRGCIKWFSEVCEVVLSRKPIVRIIKPQS